MTVFKKIGLAILIIPTFTISLTSCDEFGTAEYQEFEGSKAAAACETGLASFNTNIAPGLAGCSCHQGGQAPILARNADEANRTALLKSPRDYAYLTGGHTGANAFSSGISENQWNTWKSDESKCP